MIRGSDEGLWDRIRLVPFAVRIPEEERNPDLPGKLVAKLSGILNWARSSRPGGSQRCVYNSGRGQPSSAGRSNLGRPYGTPLLLLVRWLPPGTPTSGNGW